MLRFFECRHGPVTRQGPVNASRDLTSAGWGGGKGVDKVRLFSRRLSPEIGKVTFKSNGDEALSDESLKYWR